MRHSFLRLYPVAAFALIATAIAGAQAPAAQKPDGARPDGPIVPVHHEPHHRQVFQNGPMRILDLQLPPGDISWFHSHEWPVLYVTLANGQLRTQNLGEEWGGGAGRGGAGRGAAGRGGAPDTRGTAAPSATPSSPRPTSTTSYAERPITHRLQNVGDVLLRAMVVVNETQGDETTTQEAAGFAGTPELTNRWFRAYRVALGPGEATASHRHKAPVVFVQATAGKGVGRGAMTFELNEPGQWAFFDAGDAHEIRNTGGDRLELIEVELRRK
jgi:quercetin dioxygenase-like cupin family protein